MKPHHKERRLELGQQLLQHDLNNLLFSDESYFRTTDAHKHSAYQRRGMDQEPRPQERYVSSVLVWGCIGIGFSLLVILNETGNKERYVEMLKEFLFPMLESAFMQDNARPHRAQYTKDALEAAEVKTIEWPAKSPDLNVIETDPARFGIVIPA